jgi:hypothetical protein
MPKLNTYSTLADLPEGVRFVGFVPGTGDAFDTHQITRNAIREFILSVVPVIKGDDGKQVELRANGTAIQWRYVGDPTWIDLVLLASLKGDKGDKGAKVILQRSATHIQYGYEGDTTWTNLVALSELKGDKGDSGTGLKNRSQWVTGTTYVPGDYVFDTGSSTASSMWILSGDVPYVSTTKPNADLTHWVEFVAPAGKDGNPGTNGREVVIQKGATAIQWRYATNDPTWKDIVTLAELKGDKGNPGDPGTNGKSAEWQKSATHIQWRLVGDTTWINIVPLADIKGDPGAAGKGVPAAGAVGYILSKASATDYDTAWIPAPTGGGAGDVTKAGDNVFTGFNTFGGKIYSGTKPGTGAPADGANTFLCWGSALFNAGMVVNVGTAEFKYKVNLANGFNVPSITTVTPASGIATITPYVVQQKVGLTADVATLKLQLPDASSKDGSNNVFPVIDSGTIFRVYFPFGVTALTVTPGLDSFGWTPAKIVGAPTSILAGVLELQYLTSEGTWYVVKAPTAPFIYTRTNILGPVGQATGVPTGAIIEQGSNANGTYTKFASGLMMCSQTLKDLGALAAGATATYEWTFPAPFGTSDSLSVWAPCVDGPCIAYTPSFNQSRVTIAFYAITQTNNSRFTLMAYGRWY